MSTQCGISIKTEKGYDTIYVHSDGYPEYMWPMLTKNYNTEERARDLVALGSASCICERMVPSRDSGHSFDNPEDNVCVFYHRDRGERWENNKPDCLLKSEVLNCYYAYIWEEGKWTAYKNRRVNYNVENLH